MKVLWLLVVLVACGRGTPGPGIDVDRAMGHVALQVGMGPRPGDSAKSRATLAWIEHELAAMGIGAPRVQRMAVGDVELPEIVVLGDRVRARHVARSTDDNLLVHLGSPSGPALLVMAHYDTVEDSTGATDNAAAVATLLELARVLVGRPPQQRVVLAFTANEERGLLGAEALAARGDVPVTFAISLDLVGGTGPLVVNGASELVRAPELRWLADVADRAGAIIRVPLAHRVVSRWWPQAERSDHGPFTRHAIRALHLYHRGQDGEHIDLAYHSARDTLDRVHRASVDELGRVLVALAAIPPPTTEATDGLWLPVATNVVVPRVVVVVLEVLALGLIVLVLARMVPRHRAVPHRRGLGALAAVVVYALCVGAAVLVEHVWAGEHPAPWLHDPASAVAALACIVGGTTMLGSRALARIAPWIGVRRYVVLALALPTLAGGGLLVAGAAELAWIFLAPAAVTALATRFSPLRLVAVLAQLLPAALVLAPAQLRELAWHGFLPLGIPLAFWVGLLLAPAVATVAWTLRARVIPSGPLGTLVLPVGSALVTSVGFVTLVAAAKPCTPVQFQTFHLACEVAHDLR